MKKLGEKKKNFLQRFFVYQINFIPISKYMMRLQKRIINGNMPKKSNIQKKKRKQEENRTYYRHETSDSVTEIFQD